MTNKNNDEIDMDTLKELLLTTREKLFNTMLINVELETALRLERERAKQELGQADK